MVQKGKTGLPIGYKHSEATRKKIGLANKGKTSWRKGITKKVIRICQVCKKEFKVYPRYIKKGYGKFCSSQCYGKSIEGRKIPQETINKMVKNRVYTKETQRKKSLSQIGKKGSNWQGGKTPLYKDIRTLLEAVEWRKQIFKRDNYTCQECLSRGKVLNAHHLKSFSKILNEFLQVYSQFSPIDDKETLTRLAMTYKPFWDITNGKTLCEECHNKTKGKRLNV